MRLQTPVLIVVVFLLLSLPALAAPGAFTLTGSVGPCNGASPAVVSLTWTASSGATSYTIIRNEVSVLTQSATKTAYDDHSVIYGTFTYYVRASDGTGQTDSNPVQVTAPDCTPAPGEFTLSGNEFCTTFNGARQPGVHLTWTQSAYADYYEVWQDGMLLTTLSASQRTIDVTGTNYVPGSTLHYSVHATNGQGVSFSNTFTITISNNACPPPPSAPTLSGSAACDTSTNPAHPIVNLNWTASANATGYQVFRNGAAYAGATGTSYTDANVAAGQSYTYLVRATNSGGSADSNPLSVSVSSTICGTPPGSFTLTGAPACSAGAGGVHLTWTASSGATSYSVFRNNAQLAAGVTATSYDDTANVSVGQTYTYRVDAVNASGATSALPVNVTVSGTNCGQPGGFSADASPFCTTAPGVIPAVHVTWSPASNVTSYVVMRDALPVSGTLPSTTTSFDDAGVTAGQRYIYAVTASNAAGSTTSTAASVTPAPCAAPPSAPQLNASTFCDAVPSGARQPAVRLTWTASSGASTYTVLRDGVSVGDLPATTLAYDDRAVTGGTSYAYSVRANGAGGSSTSNVVTITPSVSVCATPPPAAPDLIPSDATLSTTSVLPGQRIDVAFTVTNAGTATAAASNTRLRFGVNAGSVILLTTVATPSLAPGASVRLSASVDMPAVAAGTYYLFITVDDDRVMPQLSTANDTLQSPAITVGSATCSATCSATVPRTATVGASTPFSLVQQPCAGAVVSWIFGDGSTGSNAAAFHVYRAPGTYTWLATVTANGTSCQSSGTITVTAAAAPARRRAVGH